MMLDEQLQQGVFSCGEFDFPAGCRDAVFRKIHPELCVFKKGQIGVRLPSQNDPETREEFFLSERLRDVIVGAGAECCDFLLFVIADRKDQSRNLAPFTQPSQDFGAFKIRQAEVEHESVRFFTENFRKSELSVLRVTITVTAVLERKAEQAAHLEFVVDD